MKDVSDKIFDYWSLSQHRQRSDTGDGLPLTRMDYWYDSGYPHDGRADKNRPHDRRIDKGSYPGRDM